MKRKIWITTDTHFGHDNLVSWKARPQGFEKLILDGLKAVLKPEDILIHLGDFCIGNDKYWHEVFMSLVPSKKWLIRGNHDNKSSNWYITHGWDWVGSKFQDKLFGKNILFTHVPIREKEVISSLFITETFDLNIHGHFHNNLHRLQEGKFIVEGEEERNKVDLKNLTEKHRLLSIEETNYKPITLESFIKY